MNLMRFVANLVIPLIASLAIIYATTWLVPQSRLLFPNLFGMRHIMPSVYVDEHMSLRQQFRFQANYLRAYNNIKILFGNVGKKIIVVACSTSKCAKNFNAVHITQNNENKHFTNLPDNRGNFVIIHPDDLRNPYALMYQLAQKTLMQRVGSNPSHRALPVWFKKGLASYASQDPRLGILAWRTLIRKKPRQPDITRIETPQHWKLAKYKYHYPVHILARDAFARWYESAGQHGLAKLIDNIVEGKPFSRLYPVAALSSKKTK